jgi:NAD(P)H-flavin reductase
MLVKKYKSRVISIKNQIEGVYTLELKSLADKYKYHPGQFLHLAIDESYDGMDQWPESRCFSMQSNPEEEAIIITYVVKGRFTKQIEQLLKVGSEVWLKLPYGDLFTQPHNKVNTVFIAGGTGITPFLSLFTHQSFREYINPRIYLGFRSKDYNIYDKELNLVQLRENLVKLREPTLYYDDINGQLDIQYIFKENGKTSDYFISGPPVMIKSFKNCLIKNGVFANQVKTDDWE